MSGVTLHEKASHAVIHPTQVSTTVFANGCIHTL